MRTGFGNERDDEFGFSSFAGGRYSGRRGVFVLEVEMSEKFIPGKVIKVPGQETLRDRFAMAALTGILAVDMTALPKSAASEAYNFADAMLAERDNKRDD